MKDREIDFVVLWVDGSDPQWKAERDRYLPIKEEKSIDHAENRYRDWDNLQYWFRGVEKFAPWVHKVYFVTNGQKPKWLNEQAEKLVFVKHSDFIPQAYLPTFSANVIENNLFRIKDLSESFVYFNDDVFLTADCPQELFFRNGLPVHPSELMPIVSNGRGDLLMVHMINNVLHVINRNFHAKDSIRAHVRKWFSPKEHDIKRVISNFFLSQYPSFVGFHNEHLAVPMRKSVMKAVWEKEPKILYETSTHRFRSAQDVNQYLFRYWNLASGEFECINAKKLGRVFHLNDEQNETVVKAACDAIQNPGCKMVCINDSYQDYQRFIEAKTAVNNALAWLLPIKSSFEL